MLGKIHQDSNLEAYYKFYQRFSENEQFSDETLYPELTPCNLDMISKLLHSHPVRVCSCRINIRACFIATLMTLVQQVS